MTDVEFKETFREVLGVSDVVLKPDTSTVHKSFTDIWDEIRKKETTKYVFTEKRPKTIRFSSGN